MFEHILARTFIHLFSAASVCLIFRLLLLTAERRWLTIRLGGYVWYILPCLLTAFVVFLREPLDVAAGGWLWKSYIDFGSWLAGALLSTWASYNLAHRDSTARSEILLKRSGTQPR